MKERSSSKDHGQLARVVRVVIPPGGARVPRMKSTGETDDTISMLAPHPTTKDIKIENVTRLI